MLTKWHIGEVSEHIFGNHSLCKEGNEGEFYTLFLVFKFMQLPHVYSLNYDFLM
jgi:hypothetical protein